MADKAHSTRRNVLKMVAATPIVAAGVKASADVADTELIALGKAFEQAWLDEKAFYASHDLSDRANDAGFEAVWDRTQSFVDQIERAEVSSLDGLRVKARAVQWCCGDEGVSFEGTTTDLRIAGQVLRTLLKI